MPPKKTKWRIKHWHKKALKHSGILTQPALLHMMYYVPYGAFNNSVNDTTDSCTFIHKGVAINSL